MVYVTFVAFDNKIFLTVICIVPLLWHVQKFQFLAIVEATSTGKLLHSLPRNYAFVNSMWLTAVIRSENYQHHQHQK
jgi:hypothetical protein